MFLGFGKRNSTPKKNETPQESPKTVSSHGLNLSTEVPNGSSRSTVQTTAGPLLSSTRFNSILDASTYANVNSPGFSSRVVNCASNGNSSYHENSATHQSKYSSVGLFPRVHLSGQSTLSILSPRNSQKVGKTPVRVRIAPPSSNLTRRHSICIGSSEAIKSKSEISKQLVSSHQQSHRKDGSLTPTKTTDNGILADNLQEASRKRIFSECQDSYDESKKRRKKTEIPIPNPNHDVYHYKHVRAPAVPVSVSLPSQDNSSQGKRAREKGSPEEQKRQRRKVCNTNNAIFSSLSSSRNLLERLTAQKRKSIDTSRSSSPLTPLNGKQVKERKPASDATSSDRNLSAAPQQNAKIPCGTSQVGTPITSKVIPRKTDLCAVEKNKSEGKSALNNSHQNSTCDYTTKLFRKDVASPVPRTPTSKTPKQSLWVQAPEVDDLSCSLLSDDAKPDRPDRLKSLLARVSGKDKASADKTSPATNDVSKETSKSSYSGVALPGNTALKALSPSSALTVTVSSSGTIMTSATVTSVNGVPSSESSHPPQTLSASVLSTKCSQSSLTTETSKITTETSKAGDTSSVGVTIVCSAPTSSSMTKQGSLINASGSSNSVIGTANEGFKPSTSFSMKSPISSNIPAVGDSKENTSVALPKPTVQFGSNSNNLQTASSSLFKLGSGAESSSAECASISTSSTSLSQVSKTTTLSGSTFQFSSSQSNSALLSESKSSSNLSTLSFGSSGNAQTGSFNSSSQLVVNGTSLSSQTKTPENAGTPKTAFSFGSIPAVSSETLKGVPQTSTSTNLEVALNPSSQFGPTTNSPALSSFQSGSNTSVSTTSFQFGSGSNGPKAGFGSSTNTSSPASNSTFQFGSNGTGLASAITPTPQFGSNTTSLSANTKPSFQFGASSPSVNQTVQFGSSNSGTSEASKSAFQFGSSNGASSGNSKPAFQFASSSTAEVTKPAVSFGSITNGAVASTAKDTFQFGGGSQNSLSANPAFQFGGSSASSPPSNQFGSNAKSQSSSSPFQFGSTTGKSLDSTKPAFQFSSSSEKPTFGLSIQGSGSAFSQVPQQQPKGTFAFSQSTNSSANTNEAKSTFTFGSANANNTQFGQGSSSPFGSSSSTQTPQPSFGSAAPKANGFGSTPSFGSAVSNSAAFSFGTNNTSGSSTNSGGAFSFGQKQETAPSFSFNATVTSIPNQSAQATPAPGLFSVGAGTSTSTRRVVRDARRRR